MYACTDVITIFRINTNLQYWNLATHFNLNLKIYHKLSEFDNSCLTFQFYTLFPGFTFKINLVDLFIFKSYIPDLIS